MDPVNRQTPDPGYVLCYDCGGSGICVECDGHATIEDGRLCRTCSGRRYCIFCGHTGQVKPRHGMTSTEKT